MKVIEKAVEFRKSFPHDPWCNEANCLTMGEFATAVDAWLADGESINDIMITCSKCGVYHSIYDKECPR